MPPLAGVLAVPGFVLAWLAVRALGRSTLRRVAAGRPPHVVLRAALTLSVAMLVAPPAILAGALLIGAAGAAARLSRSA